jgi:hypothetical protein
MTNVFHQAPGICIRHGIKLCYDIFGATDAEPAMMITGLGAQMIEWDDEFCRELAARGFRVVASTIATSDDRLGCRHSMSSPTWQKT